MFKCIYSNKLGHVQDLEDASCGKAPQRPIADEDLGYRVPQPQPQNLEGVEDLAARLRAADMIANELIAEEDNKKKAPQQRPRTTTATKANKKTERTTKIEPLSRRHEHFTSTSVSRSTCLTSASGMYVPARSCKEAAATSKA